MMLDSSVSSQTYVEDCEVCCQPWRVVVHYDTEGIADIEVTAQDENCMENADAAILGGSAAPRPHVR